MSSDREQEGREKLARLGDEPRDPDRPGADPDRGREQLAETEEPARTTKRHGDEADEA